MFTLMINRESYRLLVVLDLSEIKMASFSVTGNKTILVTCGLFSTTVRWNRLLFNSPTHDVIVHGPP